MNNAQVEEVCIGSASNSRFPELEDRLKINCETDDYKSYLKKLKEEGQTLRTDLKQPSVKIKPPWFNEELFENAKSVYSRHFMGSNFAHLSGLLLLVRVNSIFRTLSATGESASVSKLFKRYYHTLKHVKTWYEGNIFKEDDAAHRSLLIVRGMHNKVSAKFNNSRSNGINQPVGTDCNGNYEAPLVHNQHQNEPIKAHISQYDIMLTQFAFIGFIVTSGKSMGFIDDFSTKDLDSLLHFWRVIGYYLGAGERFNLCSYEREDVVGLCYALQEIEYRESMIRNGLHEPAGIMSINIVRSVKFIPMLTVYGMMKHLYKILNYETTEIESRRTWYSNLSYTLIDLVMTKLLRYKALRSFNNGLTRLSIYLVEKVENWFSQHLESKYGVELKC